MNGMLQGSMLCPHFLPNDVCVCLHFVRAKERPHLYCAMFLHSSVPKNRFIDAIVIHVDMVQNQHYLSQYVLINNHMFQNLLSL